MADEEKKERKPFMSPARKKIAHRRGRQAWQDLGDFLFFPDEAAKAIDDEDDEVEVAGRNEPPSRSEPRNEQSEKQVTEEGGLATEVRA